MTSFDVVRRVRRITGYRRVGHAGTLDPMATGLLVIAAGTATRELGDGLRGTKRYLATVRLGAASLSGDADSEWELLLDALPEFPRERIERCLGKIRAAGSQVPPMVSALKREGQPLYRLARRGWWLERVARPVVFDTLTLRNMSPGGRLELMVAGAGGLYVRSVARDLGRMLALPARLEALRRTAAGPYRVKDALPLDELEQAWAREGE